MLIAKAVVIAAVAFVVGAAAAAVVDPAREPHPARRTATSSIPVSTLTDARVILGTGALVALAAVLALALGAALRRGAGAVTAVIVLIVVPYVLAFASALPAGASQWLMRVTPAAAFAVEQTLPAVPPGVLPVHARRGLLPARARGRPGRARARMRWSRCWSRTASFAPETHERRMSAALHAEWTKLRTIAATGWLLLGARRADGRRSARVVAVAVTYASVGSGQDITRLSLTGVYLGQAVVAILAVLTIAAEYSSGMILVTLTAMPRRLCVLAAKAAVVSALVARRGNGRGRSAASSPGG